MKNTQTNKGYSFPKNWYLGFLGFIGFYKLPLILSFFQGTGDGWELLNILWFLWLAYFLPVENN